jgi:uncharacterized protein YqjF (DUF2071 family)
VKIARRFFHLPYEHAEMKHSRTADGRIRYESRRTEARANDARCVFDYAAGAVLQQPAPGSMVSDAARFSMSCIRFAGRT